MLRKVSLAIALVILVMLFAPLPCQASDAGDLELILSSVTPGQPFVKAPFLKVARTAGKDVMYEGKLGDIEILAWTQDSITDSLFLTVRGRQCPAWGPVMAKTFAPPDSRISNFRGAMLRYNGTNCEYYLVLVNKCENRSLLTDLTVFRRGTGHEINERYHEFAEIWAEIFATPAEEFRWPDPSINAASNKGR